MKFILNKDKEAFEAYGFAFTGEPVEVKSESLIAKFKKYPQLSVVDDVKPLPKKVAPKKKASKKVK